MRLHFLAFILFFTIFTSWGQAKTEWKEGYKLTVLDFQAEPPISREGQGQTYYLAANLDFNYAMSSYEFMLTKNFNKNVTAFFIPANSWLQQGEGTEILLRYAQMDFDLLELYARKFRQRLYAEKNAFSNPNFFQETYNEINAEMNRRHVEMQNAMAESNSKGEAFHAQILKEITALAEYCKECKPTKKKK
ncbi:MAG: hypothetical protein COW65_11140 [Cytophagales bacterium CG18_big_fil_WC_8_21_14_2_50_42_9]|nr:MAG: hypothetical protein COW65_11140 [Cytophagales bacterium CG18_big_fil_WC_8_21_14_2_50_42_9]